MGRNMDAIHYDKIADKLVNFHSKLPDSVDLECIHAKDWNNEIKAMIESMLIAIDNLAIRDDKGFFR